MSKGNEDKVYFPSDRAYYIDDKGIKHYEVRGPLFFASTTHFLEKFESQADPADVIVDFKESRVFDHSGIEAIQKLSDRYQKIGKRIRFRHLSEDCRQLLAKAGVVIEINQEEDPHYPVADDQIN